MENETYQELRLQLFLESYIAYKLSKEIQARYGILPNVNAWIRKQIPKVSKDILPDELAKLASSVIKIQSPEIRIIAKELDLNENVLINYFIFGVKPDFLTDVVLRTKNEVYDVRDVVIIKGNEKISPGVYVRIHLNSSEEDVCRAVKWAKENITETHFVKEKRNQIGLDDQIKMQYYMEIEEKMIELSQDSATLSRDYQKMLVAAAIERVAGELLEEEMYLSKKRWGIEEENNKKNDLQTTYYEITKRYQLPTQRKFLSILRLISP